jgi:2-oxoglutarate dehydrogenase E1 component
LYPFPHKAFEAEMAKYPNIKEVLWAQDEPKNQGYWFFVQQHLRDAMTDSQKLAYAGRPASASPAVGYASKHNEQLKQLLDDAFGKLKAK